MENEIIVQENPVLKAIKDDLFLVICILVSIACGLGLLSGGFPLIMILLTIFLWLAFVKVNRKDDAKSSLRFISGTVTAQYALNYVVAGLIILAGVLLGLVASALFTDPEVLEALTPYVFEIDEFTADALTTLGEIGGWIIGIILTFVGIVLIVYNALAMRPIRRFTKSVYENYDATEPSLCKTNAAHTALWVIGIFAILGSFSTLFAGAVIAALAAIAEGAAAITAAILMKKSIA